MVRCCGIQGYQILLSTGMLVTGSVITLSKKLQNECFSTGLTNTKGHAYHIFDHPWFQTWLMFSGEALCFGMYLAQRRKNCSKVKQEELKAPCRTTKDYGKQDNKPPKMFQPIVLVPTLCDLFATSLSGIGLIYVDASVWQILKGSIIVFTGLFSRLLLKVRLAMSQWIGIAIAMIGLCLVGLASILEPHRSVSKWHTILGIILIVVSQVVSAMQMVIEEIFLKQRNLQPLHIIGSEGLCGFFLMSAVVLPALYFISGDQHNDSYENSIDAMIMLRNNYVLAIYCCSYLLSVAVFHYFALLVTKSLTAVHRTLLNAYRTVVVWLVDLFIYYVVDEQFGESWSYSYGIIQVDGFLLLLIGTAMYNLLFDFSWLCASKKTSNLHTQIKAPGSERYDDVSDDESTERESLLYNKESRSNYNAI